MDFLKNILRQYELFSGMLEDELTYVAAKARIVSFPTNEILFKEGDIADRMFIIVKGEVVVTKCLGSGQRELRRMNCGECFGEMALLGEKIRSATVTTSMNTECVEMTEDDLINIISQHKAVAKYFFQLLNKRIKYSEEQSGQQILNAHESLIFSLADLAESRDPETGEHLSRVRNYCALLAEQLASHPQFKVSITPDFIDNIYTTSPLHDIGKVAIPDHILLKPGQLTAEEFQCMKTHSWIGASTIANVMTQCQFKMFEMAYHVAHYHHERYDGKGYPAQLKGDTIPIEARIMALADVYDALLAKRTYKEPFSYEKTEAIIKAGAGGHFDPVMTEVMLASREEFQAIHRRFGE